MATDSFDNVGIVDGWFRPGNGDNGNGRFCCGPRIKEIGAVFKSFVKKSFF